MRTSRARLSRSAAGPTTTTAAAMEAEEGKGRQLWLGRVKWKIVFRNMNLGENETFLEDVGM